MSRAVEPVPTNRFLDPTILSKIERNLTALNRFNTELWQLYMKKPKDWGAISQTEAIRFTDNFLGIELVPSASITFHGKKLSVNQWGMRDREYTKRKPADAVRIVLLGSSYTMGSGVADGKTFEALVEDRLNETWSKGRRYEILNFAVPGYSILSSAVQAQKKAVFGFVAP